MIPTEKSTGQYCCAAEKSILNSSHGRFTREIPCGKHNSGCQSQQCAQEYRHHSDRISKRAVVTFVVSAVAGENYVNYRAAKVECNCAAKHARDGTDRDKSEIDHAIKPGEGFGNRFGQAEIFGGILCWEW